MRFVLICSLIISTLSTSVMAEDSIDVKSQFNIAFSEYKKSLRTANLNSQIKFAVEAYELGKKLYGKNNINTTNLAFNLACHYAENGNSVHSNEMLPAIFDKYKAYYGENSVELMKRYITLAHSISWKAVRTSIKYYRKALDIANTFEETDPLLTAESKRLIGADLLKFGTNTSKVLLEARDYFVENLPATDERVIEATFWAGKYYMSRSNYDDAIDIFNENISIFDKNAEMYNPLELNTRAFLIYALEKEGRSEEATKHCLEIGKVQKWDNTQKPRPLFRVEPRYPKLMAKKGLEGSVLMEFWIDESGLTTDIQVISYTGSSSFKRAAINALKKWRYAPKFESGKPTKAKSTLLLTFNAS